LLLLAAVALTLVANAGSSSFGGFVGSASKSVSLSADSLANHVTVTPGHSGASLELHNPTSEPQSLALAAPAGVSANFHSSGDNRLTLAVGADDTVDISGPATATVQVTITVVRAGGVLFPSASFTAKLDVMPAA
jgi:hypothetical protein